VAEHASLLRLKPHVLFAAPTNLFGCGAQLRAPGCQPAAQNQRRIEQKRRVFRCLRKRQGQFHSFLTPLTNRIPEQTTRPSKGAFRMRSEDAGRVRCLRAVSQTAPGRLRASCPPARRPARGVLPLDWDRTKRAAPAGPRPRKPGLKSKSRGLETSARAAVERRKASAPIARRAPHPKMRLQCCAFRRSASLHLFGGKLSWRSCGKLGCGRIARTRSLVFPPPRSGGGGPPRRGGGGGAGLDASLSLQEIPEQKLGVCVND